jgi:hypothetical protein
LIVLETSFPPGNQRTPKMMDAINIPNPRIAAIVVRPAEKFT